jgi:K+-transporting ATPase ATPase C chain
MTPATSLDTRGGHPLAWLRFAAVGMLAAGLLYPAVATFAGPALFPAQAGGSLIERDGVVVGSSLVAQPFAGAGYFRPRPSAAGFDPRALAGSNLGPGNPALRDRIAASSAETSAREGVAPTDLPADLVTASGSGIDPHISPAAAAVQVARVARTRGIDPGAVRALIVVHTQGPSLGVFGQARVNVLELNLALDAAAP